MSEVSCHDSCRPRYPWEEMFSVTFILTQEQYNQKTGWCFRECVSFKCDTKILWHGEMGSGLCTLNLGPMTTWPTEYGRIHSTSVPTSGSSLKKLVSSTSCFLEFSHPAVWKPSSYAKRPQVGVLAHSPSWGPSGCQHQPQMWPGPFRIWAPSLWAAPAYSAGSPWGQDIELCPNFLN